MLMKQCYIVCEQIRVKILPLDVAGLSQGKSQELSSTSAMRCDDMSDSLFNMRAREPSRYAKVHCISLRQECILCIEVVKATSRDGKIISLVAHRVAEVILCIGLYKV